MLFWECRGRYQRLIRFRTLATDYFRNIEPAGWMAGSDIAPFENEPAQKARQAINLAMPDLVQSFALLRINTVLSLSPSLVTSGYAVDVDLFADIFQLWRFRISPSVVFDYIERAIGAYERECLRLRRKIFNPFYWVGLLIVAVLRLPFKLIGAVGFDAAKAENSLPGKLLKVVVATILFFATVIPAVFSVSEHWDQVKQLGKLLHRL